MNAAPSRPDLRPAPDRARAPFAAGWLTVFAVLLLALGLGCGGLGGKRTPADEQTGPPGLPHLGGEPPRSLPESPLALTRPDPFQPDLVALPEGIETGEVYLKADAAFAAGDVRAGTALLDDATRRDALPVRGFELARRLAGLGEIDAAMYWLGTTATDYGLHAEWLLMYPEFDAVREDPRWNDLAVWLIKVNRYFSTQPAPTPWLVLPAGHQPGRAIPVVLWFPGLGQRDPFAVWAPLVADELGVAMVAIRGNVTVGPEEAVWSGDADKDRDHVRAVIRELWNTVQPEGRRVIATGSGHGGQYAIELAAREPVLVAGVVALWPSDELAGAGSKHDVEVQSARRIVMVAGASRDPSAHTLMRQNKGRLARLGDSVWMKIDDQSWEGRLPPGFPGPYVKWLEFVLGDDAPPW